jgi:hypothetical protein
VAGYQLYRRSAAEKNFTQLNTGLITSLSYSDSSLSQAPAGSTYYYTLTAVDDSAQASVLSAPAVVTTAGSQTEEHKGNSVSTSVSCFISSAYQDETIHALSLLVLVGVFWFLGQGRRNKGALRLRSGPSALEEHPPSADLRSVPPLAGQKDASLEERHFVP